MKKPRIALFYDFLNHPHGGAEKVLLNLISLYPDAPVYTLVHDPEKTPWLPKSTKIITSLINRFPFSKNNPVLYTPFYDLALEQFDFSAFDIVISTTSTIGHCLLTPASSLFVCYFHNINRHLYRYPFLKFYQNIDYIYSRRPDYLFCNSATVQQRIKTTYGLPATIINPGIDTNFFHPPTDNSKLSTDNYLIVSRLVPHKRIDIAIAAFKKNKLPLDIVGNGYQLDEIKNLIADSPNIRLYPHVNDRQLLKFYQNCRALICPQEEDFGIAALEAMACGRPVVAYGRGGIAENITPGFNGLLFDHQTPESLQIAIDQFKKINFQPQKIRRSVLKFSQSSFMLNFKQQLSALWDRTTTTMS